MDTRRTFIKQAAAAGAVVALSGVDRLIAQDAPKADSASDASKLCDVVAVRDGTRAEMVRKAIEVLGGIGAFVKKGQKVVIKPNIGWHKAPELGANTHPEVVATLIELCKEAEAKEILVFDHACHKTAYEGSGIKAAVEKAGGVMVDGENKELYSPVEIKEGKKLKTADVHKALLEADVVINCPVLKHHGGAQMTACMKNWMGVVWDRPFFHKNDLHQCIVDSMYVRKPDLNVLDAYHPMLRNGPQGKDASDLIEKKMLIAGRDCVAVDAVGATILDQAGKIKHVTMGGEQGLGQCDLSKLNIAKIKMG